MGSNSKRQRQHFHPNQQAVLAPNTIQYLFCFLFSCLFFLDKFSCILSFNIVIFYFTHLREFQHVDWYCFTCKQLHHESTWSLWTESKSPAHTQTNLKPFLLLHQTQLESSILFNNLKRKCTTWKNSSSR